MHVRSLRAFLSITIATSVSVWSSNQGRPTISYHVQQLHESHTSAEINSNTWAFLKSSVIGRCLRVGNYDP
jgi:hypothetical protein